MKLTKRLNQKVNKVILIMITLLGSLTGLSQELTLQECQKKAEQLSPLKRQQQYITSIDALNKEVIQSNWLPELQLQARASYQSDVFGLPFSQPGNEVPSIPKDQYQLTLNLNQNIYDGGASRANKLVETANTEIKSAQLSVSLFQIRQMINDLYFSILSLEKGANVNESVIVELDNQLRRAQSKEKNGLMLSSELKSIQKQKLSVEQEQHNFQLRRIALLTVLGDWIDQSLGVATILNIPDLDMKESDSMRPELKVFAKQIERLEAQQHQLSALRKPKVLAFATTGYGSPNPYNFFETDWNSYYMIGGRLVWQPWDWNRKKKQRKMLGLNQEIVQTEQEHFEKNIQNQMIRQQGEIELLEDALETDMKLLHLQEDITATAATQFEKGVISATDYLSELNSLAQSQLQYEMRQVQLVKAKVTKLDISGQQLK